MYGVITRKSRGVVRSAGLDQRSNASEHAQNIIAGRRLVQIFTGSYQNELDLFFHRRRVQCCFRDWRIGSSNECMTVPRNCEHDPAIARTRHHDRRVAGEKRPVQHQVNPLARRDYRLGLRIVDLANRIAERAGRVDHAPRADLVRPIRFQIAIADALPPGQRTQRRQNDETDPWCEPACLSDRLTNLHQTRRGQSNRGDAGQVLIMVRDERVSKGIEHDETKQRAQGGHEKQGGNFNPSPKPAPAVINQHSGYERGN